MVILIILFSILNIIIYTAYVSIIEIFWFVAMGRIRDISTLATLYSASHFDQ